MSGSVASDQYYGLVLDVGNSASSTITVGAEGEVSGQTAGLSLRSAATVTNHGLIGTTGDASSGVAIQGAGRHTITNTGTIEASSAIIDFDGLSQDQVTNSGTVIGHINLGGGNDTLANSGSVTRGVNLGDGKDTLTNSGRIDSDLLTTVSLGADADVFTNYTTVGGGVVSGIVTGRINMGDGNDRFLGGAEAEIVQDANGTDSVALGGCNDLYLATGSFGADGTDTIGGSSGTDIYDASEAASDSPVCVNLDTVAHNLSPFSTGGYLAAGMAKGSAVTGTGTDRITGFENAKGGAAADILYGSGAANVLEGNDGADHLLGYAGNDRLEGGVSLDNLIGGTGRDILIGGAGADHFHFTSRTDSGTTAASRDVITDFEDRQDRIALDRIDAKAGSSANDAFSFIGTNVAFSGHAGELRSFYTAKGKRVEATPTATAWRTSPSRSRTPLTPSGSRRWISCSSGLLPRSTLPLARGGPRGRGARGLCLQGSGQEGCAHVPA